MASPGIPQQRRYAPSSEGGIGGGRLKIWLTLLGLVIVATVVLMGALLASKSCENPEFREQAEAYLAEVLNAEVELGPITSNGIFFLQTPTVRLRNQSQNWTCHLENVTMELNPMTLFSAGWKIRNLRTESATLWVGAMPPQPEKLVIPRKVGGSELPEIAQNLGLGIPANPSTIEIASVATNQFNASIGPLKENASPLRFAAVFRGQFREGKLSWNASNGQVQFQDHEPWALTALQGSADAKGIKIQRGEATGPREASLVVSMINQGNDGQVLLAVESRNLSVAGQYANEKDNPLRNLKVNANGQFHSQDLTFNNYLFTGRVELSGIELGQMPLFQLFANQTGEDAFRGVSATKANAEIEWEPGLLVLKQLKFEDPGLLRMTGELQAMETGIRGNLELAIPAVLAGRFPGGKPVGFSYPAGGWSQATVTVTGRSNQWHEDLTERLLAQVSTNLGISPLTTSKLEELEQIPGPPPFQLGLSQEQTELYQDLFEVLLEN